MNPVLIILVILGLIVLWFLLAPLFLPIGKNIYKIGKTAKDQMERDDSENENEKGEE